MLYLILIMIVVASVVWFKKNKYKIKWKTFLKKGFKPDRGIFGIYCYCGKQGSSKTYSCVSYLIDRYNHDPNVEIYCNLKRVDGIKYTKLNSFDDLLSLKDKTDIIIFYDEIFTALTKNTKISKEVLSFMSQMRKRRIILLTTAQEWAELPLTWRRYCRYQINCKLIRLPLIGGIAIKNIMDAENMKWSTEDNDFVAPLVENTVSHTVLKIANSYDTWETIDTQSSDKTISIPMNPDPPAATLTASCDVGEGNSQESEVVSQRSENKERNGLDDFVNINTVDL